MKSIFILSLLLLSQISFQTNAEKQADIQFIRKLKHDDFGKTILQTVQLELNSNQATVNKIVQMLKKIRATLNEEAKDSYKEIQDRRDECEKRQNQLDGESNDLQEKIAYYDTQIPLKQNEAKNKGTLVSQLARERKTIQNSLDLNGKIISDAQAAFDISNNDMNDLIQALKDCKDLISQFTSSGAVPTFLQTSESIVKLISDKQAKFQAVVKDSGFNYMLKLLLETASQGSNLKNPKVVQKIMIVVDELIDSFYNLQKSETDNYSAIKRSLQNERDRLDGEKARLNREINSNNADIASVVSKITEFQNERSSLDENLANKRQQANHWSESCKNDNDAYIEKRNNRNNQITIIERLIQIFTTHFNDVRQEISDL